MVYKFQVYITSLHCTVQIIAMTRIMVPLSTWLRKSTVWQFRKVLQIREGQIALFPDLHIFLIIYSVQNGRSTVSDQKLEM